MAKEMEMEMEMEKADMSATSAKAPNHLVEDKESHRYYGDALAPNTQFDSK